MTKEELDWNIFIQIENMKDEQIEAKTYYTKQTSIVCNKCGNDKLKFYRNADENVIYICPKENNLIYLDRRYIQ